MSNFRLEEFADENFNGGKFSKPVENIVGKREIAGYQQISPFPLCFQNTSAADR